jgi:hypothetical protein
MSPPSPTSQLIATRLMVGTEVELLVDASSRRMLALQVETLYTLSSNKLVQTASKFLPQAMEPATPQLNIRSTCSSAVDTVVADAPL